MVKIMTNIIMKKITEQEENIFQAIEITIRCTALISDSLWITLRTEELTVKPWREKTLQAASWKSIDLFLMFPV